MNWLNGILAVVGLLLVRRLSQEKTAGAAVKVQGVVTRLGVEKSAEDEIQSFDYLYGLKASYDKIASWASGLKTTEATGSSVLDYPDGRWVSQSDPAQVSGVDRALFVPLWFREGIFNLGK